MQGLVLGWWVWALLAALFAALTAIFAKIGVAAVPSDLATLVRTAVVLLLAAAVVLATGSWTAIDALHGRPLCWLTLSGLATGASWLCYMQALELGPAARVAPLDKLSVVLVAVLGATLLSERLSPAGWLGVGLVGVGALLVARG